MPSDYKKYPANWKTEIRPRILKRAGEVRDIFGKVIQEAKCERCGLPNRMLISRAAPYIKDLWNGPVYQIGEDGRIVEAYGVSWHLSDWGSDHVAKVCLTIAHIGHVLTKNEDVDLAAWCQKCHNNHDIEQRLHNRSETIRNKKRQTQLEL